MSFDQTLIADLLDQWLGGQSPDWGRLYPAGRPPIEHAPTYPFARNVYWVHAADRTPEPGLAAAPARTGADVSAQTLKCPNRRCVMRRKS